MGISHGGANIAVAEQLTGFMQVMETLFVCAGNEGLCFWHEKPLAA